MQQNIIFEMKSAKSLKNILRTLRGNYEKVDARMSLENVDDNEFYSFMPSYGISDISRIFVRKNEFKYLGLYRISDTFVLLSYHRDFLISLDLDSKLFNLLKETFGDKYVLEKYVEFCKESHFRVEHPNFLTTEEKLFIELNLNE